MMRLLLTSAGIKNKTIEEAFWDLIGLPKEKVSVAFVPTAANVEDGDKTWMIEDLVKLKNMDLGSVDIVDISAMPREIWRPRIEAAQCLIVEGGNTFHLMYWLRKSGLDKLLPELLKTRMYVGISAGSMVMSKSIFLTSDKPIFNEQRHENINDEGLGIIKFYVRPHFDSPFFPRAKIGFIEEAATTVNEPIYAIDDDSAVVVEDKKVKVISEGKWKQFN